MSDRSRKRIGLAALVVALLVGLLLWRPWQSSPERETRVDRDSAPAARESRTPSAPAAPTTVAGEASKPLRLNRATIRELGNDAVGSFRGQVINWGSGKPVKGAEVAFHGEGGVQTAMTDENGSFVFAPPALGRYGLASISAEGFLPYAPDWGAGAIGLAALPGIEIDGLVFYLTPKIQYRGLVVDADDNPVPEASVRIVSTGTGQFELMPIEDAFASGAGGRFVFSAPDGSRLQATHPTLGEGHAVLDEAAQISHELTIKLSAEPKTEDNVIVSGFVRDARGVAIDGASVRVLAAPTDSRSNALLGLPRAVADENGRFELVVKRRASVFLHASSSEHATETKTVKIGKQATQVDASFVLADGAVIKGTVVAADGAPVPAFSIVVSRRRGVGEQFIASASFFGGDGAFEIGGLASGDYRVTAAAYGFAVGDSVEATAALPSDASPVALRLSEGGVLFGTVTSAGEPLAFARVSVEGAISGSDSAQPITSSVVTDDKGQFELAGLSPPRASVLVGAASHHSRIIGGLEVASGARIGPMEISLTPTSPGERPRLELAGVGAALAGKDDGLEVTQVIDGGGAIEAGIVVGDVIIAVEGQAVAVVGMAKAVGLIRGPVDTPVRLKLRREDGESEMIAMRRKITFTRGQ